MPQGNAKTEYLTRRLARLRKRLHEITRDIADTEDELWGDEWSKDDHPHAS